MLEKIVPTAGNDRKTHRIAEKLPFAEPALVVPGLGVFSPRDKDDRRLELLVLFHLVDTREIGQRTVTVVPKVAHDELQLLRMDHLLEAAQRLEIGVHALIRPQALEWDDLGELDAENVF